MRKTKKDTKQVSYSDVAKQQPSKTNTRKSHTVQASISAPDPEPLINLESDHSSSDEAGNNKNPVPTKRARTVSKDAMDEDIIPPPVFQEKTASISDKFSQPAITAAPRTKLDQPPVDPTSNSSKSPYERPSNVDILHPELNKDNNNKEKGQNSVEGSGDFDKNTSQHANDDDDVVMIELDNSTAIVANSNYFKAAVPIADLLLENETKKQCINRLNNFAVDKFDSFFKAVRIGNNSSGKLVILVKDKTDHDTLLNELFEELKPADNKDVPKFFNYDPRAILEDKKKRSLVVRDIPMFITKDNIDARFKKFGLIDSIRLHVPHNAIFQIAEIIYENAESIKSFYQGHWSLFVKEECVRIFPASMTNEERAARQQHTAILRNLPSNIHAIDLHSIYSEINAVSIGLPRYTKSYQTKPWAYIAFKSEEAMHAAMEISCSFNGRSLI